MNYQVKKSIWSAQNGVTLIELLIVIAMSALLLTALSLLLRTGLQSSAGIQMTASTQEDSRLAMQIMTAEVGMASYNPLFRTDPGFWVNNACASGDQSYRGIPEATANSITVTMVTANGDWIGDDPNEVIRYVYDVGNQRITRETNCGGAQSFLGDTVVSGNPREVRVVNGALGLPVFRYFNGQGVELINMPADIPNIRRVEITLAVESEQVDQTTGSRRQAIYSTSALVRNHVVQ